MARFGLLLAIAGGGAVGALVRWAAVSAVDTREAAVIFGCNAIGSLLLGGLFGQHELLGDRWLLPLGTGFAGGLTTFSTFTVAVATSLDQGRLVDALVDGFGTPVTAVVAAGVGYRVSRIFGARVLAWSAARRRRRGTRRTRGLTARRSVRGRAMRSGRSGGPR
ncbi:MAG: CrcB family protein [Actinomycetota bacterium]